MSKSNSQFLGASVREFIHFWALGGEASLKLTTSGGEAKVEFNCTLGQPGAPHCLPPVPAPSFPQPPPRRPRHRGPLEKERNRQRAARHQAAKATTSPASPSSPSTAAPGPVTASVAPPPALTPPVIPPNPSPPNPSVALEEPSPTVEPLSKCDLCDYESTTKHGLSVHIGRAHKGTKKSQLLCDETFKCPSCLKLFVSEHNLWFHIYGYGGPEVQPNCVGMATVKCHICKQSESCCEYMVDHVEQEQNRNASLLGRVDGKYHFVAVGQDEVQ